MPEVRQGKCVRQKCSRLGQVVSVARNQPFVCGACGRALDSDVPQGTGQLFLPKPALLLIGLVVLTVAGGLIASGFLDCKVKALFGGETCEAVDPSPQPEPDPPDSPPPEGDAAAWMRGGNDALLAGNADDAAKKYRMAAEADCVLALMIGRLVYDPSWGDGAGRPVLDVPQANPDTAWQFYELAAQSDECRSAAAEKQATLRNWAQGRASRTDIPGLAALLKRLDIPVIENGGKK